MLKSTKIMLCAALASATFVSIAPASATVAKGTDSIRPWKGTDTIKPWKGTDTIKPWKGTDTIKPW